MTQNYKQLLQSIKIMLCLHGSCGYKSTAGNMLYEDKTCRLRFCRPTTSFRQWQLLSFSRSTQIFFSPPLYIFLPFSTNLVSWIVSVVHFIQTVLFNFLIRINILRCSLSPLPYRPKFFSIPSFSAFQKPCLLCLDPSSLYFF